MPDNAVARSLYTIIASTTVFLYCYSGACCSVCAVSRNSLNFRTKLLCFITRHCKTTPAWASTLRRVTVHGQMTTTNKGVIQSGPKLRTLSVFFIPNHVLLNSVIKLPDKFNGFQQHVQCPLWVASTNCTRFYMTMRRVLLTVYYFFRINDTDLQLQHYAFLSHRFRHCQCV